MDNLEAEKRLLCDDHLIYALSYDDLLKEKNYLVTRMNAIDEKKRDLIKQRAILETLSGKVTKRIKELNKKDNDSRCVKNNNIKRLKLLECVRNVLEELDIDTTDVKKQICKLRNINSEPVMGIGEE